MSIAIEQLQLNSRFKQKLFGFMKIPNYMLHFLRPNVSDNFQEPYSADNTIATTYHATKLYQNNKSIQRSSYLNKTTVKSLI